MSEEMMTSEAMEAELDSDWDDDGDGLMDAEPEVNQPTEQQEGTPAPENGADQTAANQQQEGEANQQTPYMIPYTFMGENKQISAAEAPQYIQMGMHYPTVRAERDRLKQEAQDNAGAVDLVKGYAKRMGMELPQYLDWARKQDLMRGGMNEQTAEQTIQMEKRQASLDAQEAQIKAQRAQQNSAAQKAKEQAEARRAGMREFMNAYPGVKPEDIPQEVWGQIAKGVPMVTAYTMHENAQLKAQLAAERQNKINQQRSPGGLGANSGLEMDEIDRDWADDD